MREIYFKDTGLYSSPQIYLILIPSDLSIKKSDKIIIIYKIYFLSDFITEGSRNIRIR